MGAFEQRSRPSGQRRVALSDKGQGGARSVDQLLAEIPVASLADPKQLRLAAGVSWRGTMPSQAERSRPAIKGLRPPDRRDEGGGHDRAQAWDRHKASGAFVLSRLADELRIEGLYPPIEFGPLHPSVGDQKDHPRAQSRSALFVHQHGQELLKLPLALRRGHAAFKQDGAQLIDQGRPLPDQPVALTMERLHVELILALQFDKAHRRPRRRFRDPLGVAIVVFLRLDIGPHILGRHQPDVVTVHGEQPAEVMRAAAGLHADHARRELLRQLDQGLPPDLAPHHDRPRHI